MKRRWKTPSDTSIESYRATVAEGLGAKQRAVFDAIRECVSKTGQGPTRREIAIATGIPLQGVCGRVRELITMDPQLIEEREAVWDQEMKRNSAALYPAPVRARTQAIMFCDNAEGART